MPRDIELGLEGLERLDRFLQWDLVTLTPWSAPVITPVGARLLCSEGRIVTSTAAAFDAKLRNIASHPAVSLLRCEGDGSAVLLRGVASASGGDGTKNLSELFSWMGGPGGVRGFYAQTAGSGFWGELYREYWRRVLISVEIREVLQLRPAGWRPKPGLVHAPARSSTPGVAPRRSRGRRGLDRGGTGMIEDGLPTVLAIAPALEEAPLAWPVQVSALGEGSMTLRVPAGLPRGTQHRASLAVRLIDDSFEVARMTGWIGELEQGRSERLFRPRSTYGFQKPPGLVVDFAAGMAAALKAGAHPQRRVSQPDPAAAAALCVTAEPRRLDLSPVAWELISELFVRRNALAPWYASLAALSGDQVHREGMIRLARRSELERDWAHALLLRGGRRIGPARGAAAALRLSLPPGSSARRQEQQLASLRERLQPLLPSDGSVQSLPDSRQELRPPEGSSPGRVMALRRVAEAALAAGAAAVDRVSLGW